jgi:signal transduction histidine kinase/HAMP domain-containing protein
MSRIRWRSLRTKIIAWSFVPTAIILVAVALVTYYAYQQVTETLVFERDQDLTRLSARQLATELAEYSDILAAEARTVGNYGGHPAVQRTTLERAGNLLVVFDGGVLILNTFGTVIAAEPKRPEVLGQDWSNRTYFRQMVRSQKVVFSDIVTDGPQGAAVIVVAVPITGNQGEFLGTMVGMFRLGATTVSAFYGSIVKLRIGQSGNTYLVDSNGRVIYHSDADHIGQDFSSQAVVQQVLNREVGAIRTSDFNGRDIVAGFAPVPGMPWGLVTEESWITLTSGSQGYGRFLLLLLVLGVLVPALVVAIGVRRITSPVTELIGAAQAVAGGNFGQTISAPTGDEIEELAEQFNRMSAQLQVSYAHLERMVADRTKELATLSAIAAVVSRSLDLEEILSDALDKALQVMEVETGAIYLLDDDAGVLTVAAHRGFKPQFVAEIDKLKVGEGFSGRVAQSGQPLVVKNVSTDPRLTRMVVRDEGLRSLASVPIRSRGKVLGVLFAVTHGYREFTDQDVGLLTAIGHQAGVAIENARLFEAERWRRQQATLLAEMAKLTSGTLDLNEVLHLTAEYAVDIFKVDHCLICLCSEPDGTLQCAIEQGFSPQVSDTLREAAFRLSASSRQVVLEDLQPLIIEDVLANPQAVSQDAALSELQAILMVPIEVGGRRLGVMLLGAQQPRQHHFSTDDGELALAMANQAGLAIESARLYEQAQQVAVLEERQRLARDLHDSATQSLYAVTMFAEAASRLLTSGEIEPATNHLYDVRETAQEALREMRLLIFELRPPILEKEGLVTALQTRLEMVEGRSGLETEFKTEWVGDLTPEIEEGLYRIAQEALNNVLKHAQAHNVTVSLCRDQQTVILEIIDDGIGFDPSTKRGKGGLGLAGMAERVALLGGELKVGSRPGQGTSVRVEVSS